MTTYVDTSILAAAIFEESGSMAARDWLKRTSERVIVSDLAGLEFAAVVSRAVRTRRFDSEAALLALASFDEIRADSLPMSHGRGDFELAERLIAISRRSLRPRTLCISPAPKMRARRSRPSMRGSRRRRGDRGLRWRSRGRAAHTRAVVRGE